MVERPHALHCPEGELARERAVAVVQPGGCGAQRAVGVRVLLENTADDLVGGRARGRNRHDSLFTRRRHGFDSQSPCNSSSGTKPIAS